MADEHPKHQHPPYLLAVIILSGICAAGIVAILLASPADFAALHITVLVSTLAPTTAAVISAMKAEETRLSVNSRLDDMMTHAKQASRAEGREEGREEERQGT